LHSTRVLPQAHSNVCSTPARGSLVERRQRAEIQELKLALAEATVQLRIWQKGSEYVDLVPRYYRLDK
jgi:hypothetical protein